MRALKDHMSGLDPGTEKGHEQKLVKSKQSLYFG